MSQNVWLKNDGSIPLVLEVQFDSIPVSGIQPTVEVVRYSDWAVADWSTNSFVSPAAAVSGQGVMEPLPSGTRDTYFRHFNPALFGEGAGRQIYLTRFRATIPSGYAKGVDKDVSLSTHQLVYFRPHASGVAAPNEVLFAEFCS